MEELARQKLPPSSISPMPPAGISFVTSANAPVWTNSGAPPLPDAVAEASALFPRNTVTRRRRKKEEKPEIPAERPPVPAQARVNGGDQCGGPGPRAEKDHHKGCGKQLSRHTGDPDSKPDDDRIHESPPPRSETTMLRTMRPETRKPYRGKLFLSMRGTFPRIKRPKGRKPEPPPSRAKIRTF